MKVAFIGLGRMGKGMARRILDAGHVLTVYDQNAEQMKAFEEAGAKIADSVAAVTEDSEVVITMLPSDEALHGLAHSCDGLIMSMPKGMIHMAMGTHGVDLIRSLTRDHHEAGQSLVAGTVLGRPDLAASGQLTMVPGGPADILEFLRPLFEVLGKQTFIAGNNPETATVVKIAHNFILGCAIEAMGEGVALVSKHGGEPSLLLEVLTQGLFGAPAYEIYGKIIVDQLYDNVGASAHIGLKDMNLALAAAEVVNMPLPSANVMRDRLLGAIAHGDGDRDWAIVAREQARASGLE